MNEEMQKKLYSGFLLMETLHGCLSPDELMFSLVGLPSRPSDLDATLVRMVKYARSEYSQYQEWGSLGYVEKQAEDTPIGLRFWLLDTKCTGRHACANLPRWLRTRRERFELLGELRDGGITVDAVLASLPAIYRSAP